MCAYGLPFTLSYLCNEIFINKMGLSPSIFIPGPLEVSYIVCSWDLVCGLQFANLVLHSDLCAWMLGRLGAKVCEASSVGSNDAWLVGSQDPQCPIFSLSVTKSIRVGLACLPKG